MIKSKLQRLEEAQRQEKASLATYAQLLLKEALALREGFQAEPLSEDLRRVRKHCIGVEALARGLAYYYPERKRRNSRAAVRPLQAAGGSEA